MLHNGEFSRWKGTIAAPFYARAGSQSRSTPKRRPFTYAGVEIRDLSPARAFSPGRGGMRGAEANQVIVAAYHALDQELSAYLGEPPLSTWLTFAKYSAREVGAWIAGLEGAWSLLSALRDRQSSAKKRLRAALALALLMRSSPVARTALGVICRVAHRAIGRRGSAASIARGLAAVPRKLVEAMVVVRDVMVEGNVELYHRMAFAFDLFLRAEAKGESGLAALKTAVRAGQIEDKTGYLIRGFAKYRLARAIGLAAAGASEPERAALESRRRRLIYDANLLIAVQEQSFVLQRPTVFGHPIAHEILGCIGRGELFLTLPGGAEGSARRYQMLPDGGNWADFATRMGFRAAPASTPDGGAFVVALPGGSEHGERYAPDWTRRGTVLDLMTRYFEGPRSDLLRGGDPRAIAV